MIQINNKIAVIASDDLIWEKARKLAANLHLPLITARQIGHHFKLLLTVTPNCLELRENNIKLTKPLVVDFLSPQLNYRIKHGGGKKQLIAKAVGIKNKKYLKVVDATAGFGIDAFVLASLGCEVVMLERSPIISVLLEDGLERFKKKSDANGQAIKLDLIPNIQSEEYMNKITRGNIEKPDVIYLDPMYPRSHKSALNKKAMRILYELVGDDHDAPKLLELALQCVKSRVVIKRPKYAESLGSLKPDLQFSANGNCRYDLYFSK